MTDTPAEAPDQNPAEKPPPDQTDSPPEHIPSDDAVQKAEHIVRQAEKLQETTPVADPDTGH